MQVLIFSQFVKVLDLLQRYCTGRDYPVERIDGGVRGNLRQVTVRPTTLCLSHPQTLDTELHMPFPKCDPFLFSA